MNDRVFGAVLNEQIGSAALGIGADVAVRDHIGDLDDCCAVDAVDAVRRGGIDRAVKSCDREPGSVGGDLRTCGEMTAVEEIERGRRDEVELFVRKRGNVIDRADRSQSSHRGRRRAVKSEQRKIDGKSTPFERESAGGDTERGSKYGQGVKIIVKFRELRSGYPQRVKRVLFRTYAVCHIVKRRDRLRAVHIGQAVLGRVGDMPVVCGVKARPVGRDLDLRVHLRGSGRRGAKNRRRRRRKHDSDRDRENSEMRSSCHRSYYITRSRDVQAF